MAIHRFRMSTRMRLRNAFSVTENVCTLPCKNWRARCCSERVRGEPKVDDAEVEKLVSALKGKDIAEVSAELQFLRLQKRIDRAANRIHLAGSASSYIPSWMGLRSSPRKSEPMVFQVVAAGRETMKGMVLRWHKLLICVAAAAERLAAGDPAARNSMTP